MGVPGVEQLPGERGPPRVAAGDPCAGRRSRTQGVGWGGGLGVSSCGYPCCPGGSDVEAERKSSESESRPWKMRRGAWGRLGDRNEEGLRGPGLEVQASQEAGLTEQRLGSGLWGPGESLQPAPQPLPGPGCWRVSSSAQEGTGRWQPVPRDAGGGSREAEAEEVEDGDHRPRVQGGLGWKGQDGGSSWVW